MNREDEILSILEEIRSDMGDIAAGRLKKPEVSGMKIEATPLDSEQAKDELKKAMEADESKEGPEGDEASESPETQELEEALGIEQHGEEEPEEEILPRWKQRQKKGL